MRTHDTHKKLTLYSTVFMLCSLDVLPLQSDHGIGIVRVNVRPTTTDHICSLLLPGTFPLYSNFDNRPANPMPASPPPPVYHPR